MIRIICVGRIKEKYLNELVADYVKRINKYHKLEIIEVKDNILIKNETKELLKHINKNDYNIATSIDGEIYDSREFAKLINDIFIKRGNITFVIGGSNGLEEEIYSNCATRISFSNFTFPHGFFRGILLEQIYRAFKINNNETYHK